MKKSPTDSSLNSNGSQPRNANKSEEERSTNADIATNLKAKTKLSTLIKNMKNGGSTRDPHDKGDMSDVKTLKEAFHRYGFTAEDTVRIHDRVKIYQKVSKDMKHKLTDLRHRRYHLAAKKLQIVADAIKEEYDMIYRGDEKKRQQEELKKLNKAMRVIRANYDSEAAAKQEDIIKKRHEKVLALRSLQETQTKQLEHHIKKLPKPKSLT